MVRDTVVGRHRLYELDPTRLADLIRWLIQLTRTDLWERRFDALETEVYRARRDRRTGETPTAPQERTA